MLHFNLLASHHSKEQFSSNLSAYEELPAIPLSSAEAYEWALQNLNQDYQTYESDKAEPLNQEFNQLDALDFTFTKSYPINSSPDYQQEQAPQDATLQDLKPLSSPTVDELTSSVLPNNSLANTNQASLVNDNLTSLYPQDVSSLSLNSTNTNSYTLSPVKHTKTRRYSYEPEHHSFSLRHGLDKGSTPHSSDHGSNHLLIGKLFSMHKHQPTKKQA